MKKKIWAILILLFCAILLSLILGMEKKDRVLREDWRAEWNKGWEKFPFYFGESGPPGPNEVFIGALTVWMPLEKILLARKNGDYCAVKFSSLRFEEVGPTWYSYYTAKEWYADYEAFYQIDKSGDFSGKDVKSHKGELYYPKLVGIGRFSFRIGGRDEIDCGAYKLSWFALSLELWEVGEKQGDHGLEFAPTKWKRISQVDVFDPRLKWYRYDEGRSRANIPIDKLWEDKPGETYD